MLPRVKWLPETDGRASGAKTAPAFLAVNLAVTIRKTCHLGTMADIMTGKPERKLTSIRLAVSDGIGIRKGRLSFPDKRPEQERERGFEPPTPSLGSYAHNVISA